MLCHGSQADRDTNTLRVIADYENPRETALRKLVRSDDESFVKISRRLELSLDDEGPVQEALKTGREVVVSFSDDASFAACTSMKRAKYAKDFNLCSVMMVPVIDEARGEYGVLEFGVSTTYVPPHARPGASDGSRRSLRNLALQRLQRAPPLCRSRLTL